MKTWIRNPKAVKPTTWMPRVWYNSNSSSPEDAVGTRSRSTRPWRISSPTTRSSGLRRRTRRAATPSAASRSSRSIGCLGCHVVDEKTRAEAGPHRTFGQPLQNIGNKTTYEWIFDWVRDPKHYSPDTYMPDLRLTDAQVADVATYLSTLKQSGGDAAKATPDQAAVDAGAARLLPLGDAVRGGEGGGVEARRAGEAARARAARHQPLRLLQLPRDQGLRDDAADRHRAVGGRQQARVAARLRVRARHPAHARRSAGTEAKLHDPRVFDQGRVLQPLEKLRMPNFEFADEEIERLLTAIMSFQREIQPAQAMPVADGAARLPGPGPQPRAPAELRRLPHHRGSRRRLPEARRRAVARDRRSSRLRARACSTTGCTRSCADRSRSGRGSTSGCRPSASTTRT